MLVCEDGLSTSQIQGVYFQVINLYAHRQCGTSIKTAAGPWRNFKMPPMKLNLYRVSAYFFRLKQIEKTHFEFRIRCKIMHVQTRVEFKSTDRYLQCGSADHRSQGLMRLRTTKAFKNRFFRNVHCKTLTD